MDSVFVSNMPLGPEWTDVFSAIASVLTAIATIILLIVVPLSLRQIRLAASSQSLASLDRVYQYLDEIKPIQDKIYKWNSVTMTPEKVYAKRADKEKVRKVSVTLNRVGFFVFKGAMDVDFLTENFSDVFIKSFHTLKPYLEYERKKRKETGKVWYIRKYFLLMVPFCQSYMRIHHPDTSFGNPQETPNLISADMLEPTLRSWLKEKGKLLSAYEL